MKKQKLREAESSTCDDWWAPTDHEPTKGRTYIFYVQEQALQHLLKELKESTIKKKESTIYKNVYLAIKKRFTCLIKSLIYPFHISAH